MKNLLVQPGGVALAGTPIDLAKVKVPSYFISAVEDHIAPWKTTYRGARALGSKVRFVLGGSGHIAGIVNPPSANKYHYWTSDVLPETPEKWLEQATQHPGSWWDYWHAWMEELNAEAPKVPARTPGDRQLAVIEDAPGSYASLRLGGKASCTRPTGESGKYSNS